MFTIKILYVDNKSDLTILEYRIVMEATDDEGIKIENSILAALGPDTSFFYLLFAAMMVPVFIRKRLSR